MSSRTMTVREARRLLLTMIDEGAIKREFPGFRWTSPSDDLLVPLSSPAAALYCLSVGISVTDCTRFASGDWDMSMKEWQLMNV